MMKKLSLRALLSSAAAYVAVSATSIDSLLLVADRTGLGDIPPDWYINAPLAVYGLVGVRLSVSLAERMAEQVSGKQPKIEAFRSGSGPLSRAIPFTSGGRTRRILTSATDHIFGDGMPTDDTLRPVAWRVGDVTVREGELRTFLDVSHRRGKHQFSRAYWLRTRRPPLYRARYEAYMILLVSASLVEERGRGNSGRLVTKPRHALTYLKHDSPYSV